VAVQLLCYAQEVGLAEGGPVWISSALEQSLSHLDVVLDHCGRDGGKRESQVQCGEEGLMGCSTRMGERR
jgi:hypothetical protein